MILGQSIRPADAALTAEFRSMPPPPQLGGPRWRRSTNGTKKGSNYNIVPESCDGRFGCLSLNCWSRVVALFLVPIFSLAAIHPTVSVVSRLSRAASATLNG